MYEVKTKHGQANLFVTGKQTYAVNLPVSISKAIFNKPRKRIALYLHSDSRENHIKAMQLLGQVQTLLDKQDWAGLLAFEESLQPKVVEGKFTRTSLQDLWHSYIKAKKDGWEPSYLAGDIKAASKVIDLFPNIYLNDSYDAIVNYLLETTTVQQTKRYLKQLSACLTWGKKRGLVNTNPLPDFISTLTTRKSNSEDNDIHAFTIKERDAIVSAFKTGRFERFRGTHTQYADYVEFLFLSGSRTSEALGLRWEHIDFERKIIYFQEARVLATNGRKTGIQKKGLKTQKRRIFPMSDRLHKLLSERRDKTVNLNANIFAEINHHTFRSGAYAKILEKLGIEYRKPYQTRHTYITILANHSDLKLHQIAKICGTSTRVIEEHYLGTNIDIAKMPDI